MGLVYFFQCSLYTQISFTNLDPGTFVFLEVSECLYK